MAAYAALVSLMYIIEQLEHHPHPPISLHKQQVQSLTEKVTFLQEFLEGYSHLAGYNNEPDALESRIADAAYAAEDVIESHIVDQILAGATSHGERISSNDFYEGLQMVIQDMDSIKKEVVETKEKMGVQDQLQRSSTPTGSLRSTSTGQNTMVGFDDLCLQIVDKLTGGEQDRLIIPIVGMGGIGKTTLAKNIYQNQVVVEHFEILIWVTISEEYRMRDILLELLQEGGGNLSQMDEDKLGTKLYQRLIGRRYLIIMDDIWDIKVWNRLKFLFPDNKNGSRVILTTRLSNLASQVADTCGINMAFLDEDDSWNLFSKTVFGEEGCPLELEKIGKKIVKNCKGLPLSIVVIGGLLTKYKHTQEYWEYVAENLSSFVNSEDDGSCLKILLLSYNQLPVHLKPCFLYMGVFEEDSKVDVFRLTALWVLEGFLKPMSGKSLEEIAEDYLKELIDRNLILVHELGHTGNIEECEIHDLLRDLCLREAQKERFYYVIGKHSLKVPEDMHNQRRVVIPKFKLGDEALDALQSMSLVRSLLCHDSEKNVGVQLPLRNFRLLRICERSIDLPDLENVLQLPNLRLLTGDHCLIEYHSLVHLFWNLHILSVDSSAQIEIWNMPQLRHVFLRNGFLPDPPSGNGTSGQDVIVLGNLHTLKGIRNFKCGEEVVKRIPNLKKLSVKYDLEFEVGLPDYCLNNLDRLRKLENFSCHFFLDESATYHVLQNVTFPHSLKELKLNAWHIHWDDMLEKIGSLPLLENLQLVQGSFKGGKWETVDGQFRSLKVLVISETNLEYWTTESSHLPRLEHLVLDELKELKKIPSDIGEIPTLKSIMFRQCSCSSVISAKSVQEEQEELQGEVGFQVRVKYFSSNEPSFELAKSLESPNFQVYTYIGH